MAKSIAIDGPAGAGKSTIAKIAAKELSFIYVDTGAMYRAMALFFMEQNIDANDEENIMKACKNVKISIQYLNGEQQVILNENNVTAVLRKEEVGKMASQTSKYKCVRVKLVELQQELAKVQDIIMDGRDIGTCVLPDADLKIYLTASVETRAKRRYDELVEKGQNPSLQVLMDDIRERDFQDMNRKESPLKQADDAVLIDSSDMTIDEVVSRIIELYNERQ